VFWRSSLANRVAPLSHTSLVALHQPSLTLASLAGTWGYVEAAREFKQQYDEDASLRSIKHIVFATGSGGTAAGLTLGLVHAFGDDCPDLVAVGVCDNVDYFYKFQAGIIADMGYAEGDVVKAEAFLRDKLTIINGRGRGYAEVPTADEMAFARDFATSSGVIVDGVCRSSPSTRAKRALASPFRAYGSSRAVHFQLFASRSF